MNEVKKETKNLPSVNIKKQHIDTNILTQIFLLHMGKKDGKNAIPIDKGNNEWMSPTLGRELSKIDSEMAKIGDSVDKKCGELYSKTETLLARFRQNEKEIQQLHDYIIQEEVRYKHVVANDFCDNKTNEMINAKRKNEASCDELGIRLRRYKEHKKLIKKSKEQFFAKKTQIKNDYQEIKKNYQIICCFETAINAAFLELCSDIEKRTSWYWQGVLQKHPKRNNLPQTPPKPNNGYINNIYLQKINDLERKIENIEDAHDDIMALNYIE